MQDDLRELRIAELILQSLRGELTDPELQELARWEAESEENRRYLETQLTEKVIGEGLNILHTKDEDSIRRKLNALLKAQEATKAGETSEAQETPETKTGGSIHIWPYMVAAGLIGLIAVSTFLWKSHKEKLAQEMASTPSIRHDVAPGGNKAVLTLANGHPILLDSAANGELSKQGSSRVVKLSSGKLLYEAQAAEAAGSNVIAELYNTLETPAAGQFQVTLPDGTAVWLNNASTLRYPTHFSGRERLVELRGEAYFEVAKNTGKPFRVKVLQVGHGLDVEVLGTAFNIMAYSDEGTVKTTLLEGAVNVRNDAQAVRLHPGEQARLDNQQRLQVGLVDTRGVIAWKKGFFNFDNSDLRTVMRQLSRWYAIEVVYDAKVPDRWFDGAISRNLNLSQVLNILEKNQVHFTLEDKKLIVRP